MDWSTCFEGKKILIVEDDAVNRDLMSDIMTQMKVQVDFAASSEEAMEKVRAQKYDVILMDLRLPNKDGFQVTQEIRGTENQSKGSPIIAVTASTSDSAEDVKKTGMTDLIYKPINLDELRKKLAEILLGGTS